MQYIYIYIYIYIYAVIILTVALFEIDDTVKHNDCVSAYDYVIVSTYSHAY